MAARSGWRAGKRPALILTRQAVIPHLNKVTVAEITSVGKGYPTEVALDRKANLAKDSFVQLDNLQTVSKDRFVNQTRASTGTSNTVATRNFRRRILRGPGQLRIAMHMIRTDRVGLVAGLSELCV